MTFFDAQLARYKILKIEPVGPLIGATVHGVDLADVSDEALRAELRRALADFQVLFFRNQTLTPEQQLALARVYGDPDKAKAFFPRLPGQSAVEIVETAPNVPRYGTDQWHADITFCDNPPTGTTLYAKKIPPIGGDTAWASATAAYDLLPTALKQAVELLEAVHSIEHSGWPPYFEQLPNGAERYAKARAEYLPVVHPVVRTHPVTGKKIFTSIRTSPTGSRDSRAGKATPCSICCSAYSIGRKSGCSCVGRSTPSRSGTIARPNTTRSTTIPANA